VITDALVKKSLDLMASSPANHEYFFMKLKTPDWIDPLWNAGRFKDPPKARRQEGTIGFPPWPESQYLVRVAADAPELVKQVILKMPQTDNQRVHQDFVEAAERMPGPTAAEVAAVEAAWIREQNHLYVLYPDKVSELIAHLADQGEVVAALKLAGALLRLSPDPRPGTRIGEGEDALEMPRDAVAKFDDWHYQQSLRTITKPLVVADPERGLQFLCDVLESSLKAHVRPGPSETEGEDYSWIWRPHIEIEGHGDVKDSLVSAVRDAAVLIATSNIQTIPTLLDRLIGRRWRVFRRIAAEVLVTTSNTDLETVTKLLGPPFKLQDYPQTVPELAEFLRRSFSNLPEGIQNRVLTNIDTGPNLDTYKQNFELAQKRAPTTEELEALAQRWKLQWLEPIHEALPNGEWHNRYQELVKRFGQPAEVTQQRGVFVGPTSPKTVQELRELEPEKLIEYLEAWVPSNNWASPTPAGLARELTSLVSSEPEKLSQLADKLIGLDPTYISSAIEGFSEAAKKGLVIDWSRVLNLCEWVVEQNAEIANRKVDLVHGDPDWIASRIAVGRLLREGFAGKKDAQLPKEFRTKVWALLAGLVNGPDPTAARVLKYAENSFPGTISLNAPRGIALDAVIDYGLWIHPYDPKKAQAAESAFSEMPEVRELLDKIIHTDSSLASGEVLGRRFPALFMLDRSWLKDKVELIFRPEPKQLERVAWINYLLFCPAYDDLLPLLTSQYEKAIDPLAAPLDSRVKRESERNLVTHLVSFFWRGRLDVDDEKGLLARFFEKAPVEQRAYAIEVIGRSLGSTPLKEGDSQDLLERLRKLLANRINAVKQNGKEEAGELEPFGWWFISNQFDADWLIENLLTILRLSRKISPDWLVVECLSKEAQSKPVQSVEALEWIVVGDKEGWAIYGWEQHARELLKTALESDNHHARDLAVRVINIIGSRGQYGFRDLLRTPK
jgi:hypothetical protein